MQSSQYCSPSNQGGGNSSELSEDLISYIPNKLKFILLYKVRQIYMYFLKESTKDVGTFRRIAPKDLSDTPKVWLSAKLKVLTAHTLQRPLCLVRFVLYKSNGHKGVFSFRYCYDAAAGHGEILIT